ncbi:hypothetical protein R5R35_014558 [Gryllus longicercus]|uniref:tRNA-splicing endonuclease subunit Sen34 n=1 Tax=Gryllus longicercus TaxID=2509291 RepID=A0AAN9VHN8_9ORTH
MIEIIVTEEGIPLIFNAEDWLKLREEHRIVGSLVGCLAQTPYQDHFKGLPLALLPEEATLLRENNVARLINHASLLKSPSSDVKAEYDKYCEKICDEQIECLMEERKRQITGNLDNIVAGKQRKLMGLKTKKKKGKSKGKCDEQISTPTETTVTIDRNKVLEEELSKVKPPPKSAICVQIFTAHPWLKSEELSDVKWNFPSSPTELLRYNVFRHFWQKGYFLTSGMKYGGDFLVYPGDPFQFHAYFVVICIDKNAPLRPVDLAALGRLGTAARKSIVLAYEGNNKEINYQTLKWSPIK